MRGVAEANFERDSSSFILHPLVKDEPKDSEQAPQSLGMPHRWDCHARQSPPKAYRVAVWRPSPSNDKVRKQCVTKVLEEYTQLTLR